jgi:hypothetical protein
MDDIGADGSLPALRESARRIRAALPWLFAAAVLSGILAGVYHDFDVVPTVVVTGIGAAIVYVAVYARDAR